MDWIVQNLYRLVEAYWILGWPSTSWVVALLLVGLPTTTIGLLIGLQLSSGPSSGGCPGRTRSMGPGEPESG
ncbi:hypothetical protein LCGC14_2417430 [marine sediment metagenome]|uniref:Uncharacterized protein n=1 Tax=marine sediment metagenome TaxID=412755 RepID=A0A0F9E2V5_9ZZZZ